MLSALVRTSQPAGQFRRAVYCLCVVGQRRVAGAQFSILPSLSAPKSLWETVGFADASNIATDNRTFIAYWSGVVTFPVCE